MGSTGYVKPFTTSKLMERRWNKSCQKTKNENENKGTAGRPTSLKVKNKKKLQRKSRKKNRRKT